MVCNECGKDIDLNEIDLSIDHFDNYTVYCPNKLLGSHYCFRGSNWEKSDAKKIIEIKLLAQEIGLEVAKALKLLKGK